jgi:RNA polymerase sigma factor (sigma-70 family)
VERFSQQRNIASHQARHLLRSFRDTCSLNLPPAQGSDSGTLANQIVDERQPEPRELAESRERNFLVRKLLKSLPGREETVLSLRFGFFDGIHRSLAEVGKSMNLTRERVRQIERTAIEKLAAETTNQKWEGVRSYEPQ